MKFFPGWEKIRVLTVVTKNKITWKRKRRRRIYNRLCSRDNIRFAERKSPCILFAPPDSRIGSSVFPDDW